MPPGHPFLLSAGGPALATALAASPARKIEARLLTGRTTALSVLPGRFAGAAGNDLAVLEVVQDPAKQQLAGTLYIFSEAALFGSTSPALLDIFSANEIVRAGGAGYLNNLASAPYLDLNGDGIDDIFAFQIDCGWFVRLF